MRAARRHEELIVWQLGDELRRELTRLTSRPEYAMRARRLREQTDDAIDSVCRNVAADTHGPFAWFLRVSRRSLHEVEDAVHSARYKELLTEGELKQIRALVRRIVPALNGLIRYLERNPKQRNRPL